MVCCTVLCSNNPAFSSFSHEGVELIMLPSASAHEVLLTGRDRIHAGWRLLNHPLYGNFRPGQQPYRSLLLAAPGNGTGVDADSLHFIEEALGVYEACKGRHALADNMSEIMLRDCAFIDRELMQATLEARIGRI